MAVEVLFDAYITQTLIGYSMLFGIWYGSVMYFINICTKSTIFFEAWNNDLEPFIHSFLVITSIVGKCCSMFIYSIRLFLFIQWNSILYQITHHKSWKRRKNPFEGWKNLTKMLDRFIAPCAYIQKSFKLFDMSLWYDMLRNLNVSQRNYKPIWIDCKPISVDTVIIYWHRFSSCLIRKHLKTAHEQEMRGFFIVSIHNNVTYTFWTYLYILYQRFA